MPSSSPLGLLRATLEAGTANLQKGLDGMALKVRAQAKGMNRLGRQFTAVGGQMRTFGAGMTAGFTLPMLAAGAAALKFSTGLNRGMAEVATLIPGNTKRVMELKREVQGLAVAHGKDTSDLAKGLYQTISAFGDEAGDTVKKLEINSKAATAGLASTLDAINLTSAVTKAYGDTSANAVQKVSDLSFVTVKLGQTTFPELAASMGRVAPIAATLGVAQEELFAGFATLTGVTGGAAEVSTQLAAILRAMLKPTAAMTKAVRELGFESAQAMVSQLGMKGSLDALISTTDGSQEAIGKLFGRAEALNAVFNLTGQQSDVFAEKLDAMADRAGATDEAFDEFTQGINANEFKWKQFTQTLVIFAQRVGDRLAPAATKMLISFKPVLEMIERMFDAFTSLPQLVQTLALGLTALAAAVGPLALIFQQVLMVGGAILPILAKVGLGAGALKLAALAATSAMKLLAVAFAPLTVAASAFLGFKIGQKIRRDLELFPNVIKTLDSYGEALDRALGISKRFTEESQKAFEEHQQYLKKHESFWEAFGRTAMKQKEEQERLADATREAAEEQERQARASAAQAKALELARKKAERLAKTQKRLADQMRRVTLEIEAAFKAASAAASGTQGDRLLLASARGALPDLPPPPDALAQAEAMGRSNAATRAAFDRMIAQGYRVELQEISGALRIVGEDTGKVVEQTMTWSQLLANIANQLQSTGGIGSFFGKLLGGAAGIGSVLEGLGERSVKGVKSFFSGSFSDIAKNLTGGLAAAFAAIDISKAIVGLFKKTEAEKVAHDVGRDLGVDISEGLAKAIAEDSKRLGDRVAATLLHLKEIIAEAGGVEAFGIDRAIGSARDLFVQIETGKLTVEEAGAAFNEVFGEIAPHAIDKTTGIASAAFLELIELNKQFGTNAAAVNDWIRTQAQGAIGNFEDLIKQVGVSSESAAATLGNGVAALFTKLRESGMGPQEALGTIKSLVEELRTQLTDAGFEGSEAFAAVERQLSLLEGAVTGPLLTSIGSASQSMVDFHNLGLLNQETFALFARTVTDAYGELGDKGPEALALIGPDLQRIKDLQEKYGFEVDEATQKMIDEAEAARVLGDAGESENERMIDATNRLATVMENFAKFIGVELPRQARRGADGMNAAFGTVRSPGGFDFSGVDVAGRRVPRFPRFAQGGIMPHTGIAHLEKGELAIPPLGSGGNALEDLAGVIGGAVASAMDGMGVFMDGDQLGRIIRERSELGHEILADTGFREDN